MTEPVTTDNRISFIDMLGRRIVFDQPGCCPMCNRCLKDGLGNCPYHDRLPEPKT